MWIFNCTYGWVGLELAPLIPLIPMLLKGQLCMKTIGYMAKPKYPHQLKYYYLQVEFFIMATITKHFKVLVIQEQHRENRTQ